MREAQKNASEPLLPGKDIHAESSSKAAPQFGAGTKNRVEAAQTQKKPSVPDKKKAETARPKLHLEPELPVQPVNATTTKQPAASARKIVKEPTPPLASQKTTKPKK